MKTCLMGLALLALPLLSSAQELPKPSPFSSVSQRVGLTDITVEYSRPSMKGRTIFGDLVPFDKMWRTGANMNTTIELSTKTMIGGKEIPAGKYSLFTIPGKEKWDIIINSKNDHSGTSGYAEENDVVRFSSAPIRGDKVETFTIGFADITPKSTNVVLSWAGLNVSFEIIADPSEQAKKNIETAIAAEDADFRVYHNSARWYLDNDGDIEQAIEWQEKSVGMDKRFWNVHWLAKMYAAAGRHGDALQTAMEGKELAMAADYDSYVKMNDELIAEVKGKMKK